MTTIDPEDPLDHLDWDAEEPDDVDNFTQFTNFELVDRRAEVVQAIADRRELLNPRTQQARDLHSEAAALLIEMRRRGILP